MWSRPAVTFIEGPVQRGTESGMLEAESHLLRATLAIAVVSFQRPENMKRMPGHP